MKLEVIKYRPFEFDYQFKHESLMKVGDVYIEQEDNWFKNQRTLNRTKIQPEDIGVFFKIIEQ